MKRYLTCVSFFLLAGMLVSCGGGGGGDSPGDSGSPGTATGGNPAPVTSSDPAPATGGNTAPVTGSNPAPATVSDPAPATGSDPAPATGGNPGSASSGGATPTPATTRFEESDTTVSMSAGWTQSKPIAGWSGGKAVQSDVAGAKISFTFTGTSVRWIGARGRGFGIALVKVDDGPVREVDLFARPNDEIRTPIVTFYDLSDGPHTLTIEVAGRHNPDRSAFSSVVVVDAFDVQPQIVSHYQDADPDLTYVGSWTTDVRFGWSGSGVGNPGDPPVGAHVTEAADAKVTLKFRGTGITWSGYRGPDAGIALVQVDEDKPVEVDTYAATIKVQEAVFTATGLADKDHTLTITATGQKRDASTAAKVFVDAFDVTTPGRRYEDPDMSVISYSGSWTPRNDARVWSEGSTHTSNQAQATATFSFTGTSVSWIGCSKASAGGTVRISIDGAFVKEVSLARRVGIEGYQRTIFRADGLTNGPHTLMLEVVSTNGAYVVVDAFDVHP